MDNVTHSLIGLFVADVVTLLRARVERRPIGHEGVFARLVATTSVFANNVPDLDFVYTGITGGKLGYLLHHRGHTHTFIAALPLALFCFGLALLIARLRGQRWARADLAWLLGTAAFGCVLHIAMDFGNNYGVHPFWPIDNHWYYADLIFIVDPWLLITLAGVALAGSGSMVLRGVLLVLLGGLLGLAWFSRMVSPGVALLLTSYAFLWCPAAWLLGPARRLIAASAACGVLFVVLLATRHSVRSSAHQALDRDREYQLSDLISTPAPGNPLCWWLVSVQHSETRYVARQALASALPALWPVQSCSWPTADGTAPRDAPSLEGAAAELRTILWGPEFRAPLQELTSALQRDCVGAALMRFVRAPFWVARDGRVTLLGDLRYDRSSALEFTELRLDPDAPCPRNVPPWVSPFAPAQR